MSSPVESHSLTSRLLVGLTAFAVGLGLLLAVPATAGAAERNLQRLPAADSGAIRMVAANLRSPQSHTGFIQDVRRIRRQSPDFIAYNEVAFRSDRALAPDGYALFRDVNGPDNVGGNSDDRYGRDTPVAWRTDRWEALDQGTWMLTNKWGKEPGKVVHLGVRHANFVTLRNIHDGRVMSVISVHFPPKSRSTEDLRQNQVAAKRLRRLVNRRLGPRGPVLVGGDLNIHFRSRLWPRAIFDDAGLTATWDMTGRVLPTGDHHGYTIDHILVRTPREFDATGQWTMELNSDHDAVVADLRPTYRAPYSVRFGEGRIRNAPHSDLRPARRRVVNLLTRAVNNAQFGSGIHLDVAAVDDVRLVRALKRAHRRGVAVQVVTRRRGLSDHEKSLRALLGTNVQTRTFGVGCRPVCRRIESSTRLPATRLLVSKAGGTSALRIIASQPATERMVNRRAVAWVHSDLAGYNHHFDQFLRLVGRRL